MSRTKRIIFFLIALALLFALFLYTRNSAALTDDQLVVLFSALLMLALITLFLEHFFTTPTDVVTSTIAILLLITPQADDLAKFGLWYDLFYGYTTILLIVSLLSLLLLDGNKPRASLQNRISQHLKNVAVRFGNGKFLFSLLFLLTLLFYVDSQSGHFIALTAFSALVVFADPAGILGDIISSDDTNGSDIGRIFGVRSRQRYEAELFEGHDSFTLYDLVVFRHSGDSRSPKKLGLITGHNVLSDKEWITIYTAPELEYNIDLEGYEYPREDLVVKRLDRTASANLRETFVGTVTDKSTIGRIRFRYAGSCSISEGDLLETTIRGSTVLYQVTQGITEVERLEAENEGDFVIGEAVQLGEWNADDCSFSELGWVPDVNTPVFKATGSSEYTLDDDDHVIGSIPGTEYPVVMDLNETIKHHLGILGVTGCGKSVLARHLINEVIERDTKVICVDFTGEYRNRFDDHQYRPVVAPRREPHLFELIDKLEQEKAKFKNNQDSDQIDEWEKGLRYGFGYSLKAFLKGRRKLALFELPDVSNTTGILEYTRWFFDTLFLIARKRNSYDQKLCVVLEEAHTVVPEWNFIGVGEKKAQSLVNKIGQIALQGRKYEVGFIVVAQRTANVSKTVLTQCNSIISFQQFDDTSAGFLENYMGEEMVEAVPNLTPRHAVAVGKGFRSRVPMIFRVPELPDV